MEIVTAVALNQDTGKYEWLEGNKLKIVYNECKLAASLKYLLLPSVASD